MSKRILLVDDDRDLVETMSEALEAAGYQVICAYDGVEAWDLIKRGKPDLIVLDVMMPNKHGYQVAEELEQSEYSHLPLIMLTAVAEHMKDTNFSRSQRLPCQADEFIGKPVKIEVLLKSIRRLLQE